MPQVTDDDATAVVTVTGAQVLSTKSTVTIVGGNPSAIHGVAVAGGQVRLASSAIQFVGGHQNATVFNNVEILYAVAWTLTGQFFLQTANAIGGVGYVFHSLVWSNISGTQVKDVRLDTVPVQGASGYMISVYDALGVSGQRIDPQPGESIYVEFWWTYVE